MGQNPPPQARTARLCVIVLNWNQAAMTCDCVTNLYLRRAEVDFATVVVDNGSRADQVEHLERHLPQDCVLIRNRENLGFAGGMNVGIAYALARPFEFVWLLNNDAFPEAECLARLMAAAEADADLAAATPRLIYADGTAQAVGSCIDWTTGGLLPLPPGPLPRPTPAGCYVTGAALFVRVAALRALNGFDERFFAYWEDFDLCVRLVEGGRWHIGVVDSAVCLHLERASTGRTSPVAAYLMVRNAWLFMRKHKPVREWPRLWMRHAALQLVHAGALESSGEQEQASAIVLALGAAARGRFGRPPRMTARRTSAFVLRHYWGIARGLWACANQLSPMGASRVPLSRAVTSR
jgi:GT2 family glycosyltransferase